MATGTRQAGLVVWMAAFVVPAALVGWSAQGFIARHPGPAVAIGVAYMVLMGVALWRWQVDLFPQRRAARFERRYRQFVLKSLRFIDHKGLPTVGPFTPELDAVFVNVSLVQRPPQLIGPGILLDAGDRAERRVLDDFLGRANPAVLAVVGSPGSGKTTLLRNAALQACLRKRSRRSGRGHVRATPILLYLRDHAAAIIAEPTISVATLVRATLGAVDAEEPSGWFEQRLRAGRCLILLDGLDEVTREDDRAKVSAWAEGQIRQYPANDFVISSRPQGYQAAPIEGATILEVHGFTASQVEAFVRGWYRAVERHSTGDTGPETDKVAEKGADDLLRRLEWAPALYDLTVNPLLLTMIANVHRYRGALPGSRADLYSEILQVLLWRRQEAKNIVQPLSGDKKEAILRNLAYMMMKRRVSDMSRAEVIAVIQPTLRRTSGGVTPERFLADVGSNGILIERETGLYSFAHRTFQEYLAAEYSRVDRLVAHPADVGNDDESAQPMLLNTASSDNIEQLVREVFRAAGRTLRQGSHPQLLEPGPVWISADSSPAPEEIERFGRALPPGNSGYFVHVGDLPRNVSVYVDGMRVSGKKVVTVTVRALQAALAAGEAAAFLGELEQLYGSRDNLFDTKNALIDDRFLFGRDSLLTRIGSAIERDEHVLISGLRKAGKTSLLNILRQHLVSYPVCLVDLQRFDRRAEDWPPTLFTMMVEAVDRWGRIGRKEWPFEVSSPATATELATELDRRFTFLSTEFAKQRVVLMLDEIERVFPKRGEGDATHRWVRATGALRALAQNDNRSVVVIGADLRPTANRENELDNGETNPFFSFFQEIPVALLDHSATGDMVESLASAMGVNTVDKAFVDQIFALTGGHPSLARTIAGEAYRGRQNPGRLDVADLEIGVEALHDSDGIGSFIRNNLWRPMTSVEKEILSDLSRQWIAHKIARRQRSDIAFAEGYASLRSQGIIGDGGIRVGLLRQWVRDYGEG